MGASIYEFFGYRATDRSDTATEYAVAHRCPFLPFSDDLCEKTLSDGALAGACSIKPVTTAPVICCPIRLYADDYRVLHEIARRAFGPDTVLLHGPQARGVALHDRRPVVAVFGQRWGGELRLPKKSGRGSYFVDWILALVSATGELQEFVAVEVQTMDTTGNYRIGRLALLGGRRELVPTGAGINWENVSKRIIPQLVYKGQVLQREKLCRRGLYFVCPRPVLERVLDRLGGTLPTFPDERASITFLAYDYAPDAELTDGAILPLAVVETLPTSVEKLKESFNNVTLEEANVYQSAIEAALENL